jgi:acyl carrier protein
VDISEQLRRFIYQNFLLAEDFRLGDSDSFLQNGVIDSMGVLELVAFLQDTYGITVENEELIPENLDSVQNLTEYVLRKLGKAEVAGSRTDIREQI